MFGLRGDVFGGGGADFRRSSCDSGNRKKSVNKSVKSENRKESGRGGSMHEHTHRVNKSQLSDSEMRCDAILLQGVCV